MASKDKNTKKSYGEETRTEDAKGEATGEKGQEVAGYARRTAGCRRASACAPTERATPETAAALALVTSRRPDASEKLIATSLPTPSANRMPAVAPTFATAPPAVIGMTPAAALRHSTQSAVLGEKAKPSAFRSKALPTARVVQQANK